MHTYADPTAKPKAQAPDAPVTEQHLRWLLTRVATEAARRAWLNGAATGHTAAEMGLSFPTVADLNPHSTAE